MHSAMPGTIVGTAASDEMGVQALSDTLAFALLLCLLRNNRRNIVYAGRNSRVSSAILQTRCGKDCRVGGDLSSSPGRVQIR